MTFQVSFIMLLVDIWRKRTKSDTLEGHLTWDRACHDFSGWLYIFLVDISRKRTKSETLEGHLTWDRTCHDFSGWRYNALPHISLHFGHCGHMRYEKKNRGQ